MRILVLGYIVRGPLGGLAWHHFQYVLGLKAMGHDVVFLEDSDNYPCCYNPELYDIGTDPGYGLKFINDLFSSLNVRDSWAYFDYHTTKWYGQSEEYVKDFCRRSDMVINLSGVNPIRDWWFSIPVRLMVDTDPVFTQIRNLTDKNVRQLAEAHTHFATFGENFQNPSCSIPDDHLPWFPTRQPVYLPAWKVSPCRPDNNWTTVMQWDSYKEGIYDGKKYGMKSLSFSPYNLIPGKIKPQKIELALGSTNAPVNDLKEKGWIITDPFEATSTPKVFQDYIAGSKGEWTISKQGYVITNSGWFSERTLNYMASGRPVVIQDTGFKDFIPTGKGILTFSNCEEAIEKLKEADINYNDHCLQARKIVEEFFESKKVLSTLLNMF